MQCALFSLLGLLVLGCLLRVAAAGGGFLKGAATSAAGCVANGEACQEGVDCCGVCAYIGAETWRCQACTPLGEECIPMGNRCCDGGDRQKDVHLSGPKHECRATDEMSSKYGTTKYTCQAAALQELVNVTMPAIAPEVVPQPLGEQQGSDERAESNQCTPDGEACKLGVDCCGVCVFMGRGSECRTCVAPGGACFDPYSNPCCGGATKRYEQVIVDPAYTCQLTGQKVELYGIEQYTCQPAKP